MESIDLLHNLMLMARADGEISKEELELLHVRRNEWNISLEEFERILEETESPSADLRIPESASQRYDMLADMALMMAADGKFSEFETQLLAIAAVRLELKPEVLDEVLSDFSDDDDDIVIG
jgi:uncharacterized tellurite resistance protein B-like protein